MPPPPESSSHWALDKRIPLALIVTVLSSSVALGGQAMLMNHRVAALEKSIERLEGRFAAADASRAQLDRDIAARDGQVREALANLNGATASLRDVVSDLRAAVRSLEARQNAQGRPSPVER